jgi:hypothetical protein
MSKPDFDDSEEPTFTDLDSPSKEEIKDLLAKIEHSHHLRYKLMNLEAWSLAETMDHFIPGFWSRFLENRRTALKQFLEQKRKSDAFANSPSIPETNDSDRPTEDDFPLTPENGE